MHTKRDQGTVATTPPRRHAGTAVPRLLISATHKSAGKTTVTLGLAAALHGRGVRLQTFKKGPDYIDPLWLGLASERPCRNLDFYLMSPAEIGAMVAGHAAGADLVLIEGNKGLYDGLDLDGSNSNAALAVLLEAPVVLVIDARGMTRGVAPLILGHQRFDPRIHIGGVILNQLGGTRHESKLRAVIEHYTDVPVLGAVHHDPAIALTERHLGLVPSNELDTAALRIAAISAAMARQVDLDRVLAVAQSSPVLPFAAPASTATGRTDIRIGVARDAAFGFYYPDDLEALHAAGAELVAFDTLQDVRLPAVDALFIGGGFPETHMAALERNAAMRHSVRAAVEGGLPVYAECGGLMYLARSIRWHDRRAEMVGVIPADIVMHDRPVGRGYVRLRETGAGPWPYDGTRQREIRAHEFHYSSVENLPADTRFAYDVLRGHGVDGQHDGILYKNVLASYTHLRDVATHRWADRFVRYVRHQRTRQPSASGTDLC